MAYNVAERTREIGVRIALGALPAAILRQSLGRGLKLIGAGVCLGAACALALGRLLSSLIFGVSPSDPFALGLAFVALTATALLASYLPARRAASIDPVAALRCE
jgi:putative ABC transport system permease protein